ncbi:hypothetical protein Psesu_1170 [Pseudoxanthomonas suwonensis 11-1]|uniref:Uncharacterized protein n=1 Tax=Pseudoxanthomonas suwonensis (strain 11-1) TaxID=743721 RepID=E6WS71_PSEUU|nr:hypothetical protein [Pseudoxanthomonas suwonensis]ADV27020.1 hypothetical protein Psesu_1170 [Pseudoxanthomonas suwonensis 11-1]
MRNQPVPLVTGFYADQDRPFSQQDVWNYLPCRAEKQSTRSPLMLKTPPGLFPWLELEGAPPVRGIHDCEGRLFAVIGSTLYRLSPKGVAIPIGSIPGTGRVSMDHNQRANGQQLTVVNGSAGYVFDTHTEVFERITDSGFPGSPIVRFMDGYMLGLDPAGRFAFSSGAANALDYNTLDRWTSEYRPDRLVSMARLGGELLLLSANSGEFFGNTGAAQQPFRSKRIFLDKGCAGPHTAVEADNTVFWLGSDGYFYQLDGYNSRRISTRPIEQAIRGQDWWNAFGFVWESEGHTVVYWTFLNGQTWGWDTSQQEWHRRESYGLDRWRPSCTARSGSAWYAGDFQKGRIWRLDWGYPWEGDTEFVSGFTLPVIHDNQNELVHSRLELVMDVGQVAVAPSQFPEQPDPPSIEGHPPDGVVSIPYAGFQPTVTQGSAGIAKVAIVSGSLPPGIEVSNGVLGTEPPQKSGTYTATWRVTDSNGLWAEMERTFSVACFVEEPTQFMVHAYGQVRFSADGLDWGDWEDATITGSLITGLSDGFVIYGTNTPFVKTVDGSEFTPATGSNSSPSSGVRQSQASIDGEKFVAAGGVHAVRYTTDIAASFDSGEAPSTAIYSVVPLGAGWLGVQTHRLYMAPTPDGSWTETLGAAIGRDFLCAWSDGGRALIGGLTPSGPAAWFTSNGASIGAQALPFVSATKVTAVCKEAGGARWLLGTDSGELAYLDDDGEEWVLSSTVLPHPVTCIAHNGMRFVATCQEEGIVDHQTEAWYSNDGDSFTHAWTEVAANAGVTVAATTYQGAAPVCDITNG